VSRKISTLCAALCMTLLAVPSLAAPGTVRDVRIPIIVTESERAYMLAEMREFLHGLHSIQLALARGDMKAVALVAGPMGSLEHKIPPALKDRLPEEFLQLAIGQHEVFQVIARDAEAKQDIKHTLGQVAEAITYCSGCHDTFRIQAGRIKPAVR